LGRLENRNYHSNKSEIQHVSARIDEILHREEIMWRQRSRIQWLKEGDQNTKFFHRKATGRDKKNKIRKLKRTNGTVTNDENEFKDLANNFFKDLYTKDEIVNPTSLLELIQPMIPNHVNQTLLAEFTEEEIGDALFQIGPLKAPGPDGLPARFF
jgi:hypothetical protein